MSAGAELYALTKGSAQALGAMSLLQAIRGIMDELKSRGVVKNGEIGFHAVCDEDVPFNGPDSGYSDKYRDDISGQVLKDCLVREARSKELEYFNGNGVWRKCNFADAFANSGHRPISVRWVDVNKGDELNPEYRSRLLARQL